MNKNDVVRLALDIYHGSAVVPAEFSDKKPEEVLRSALIELNGGSSTFDYKAFRRNKVDIFEIVEQIVPVIVNEGLQGDEFFMNLVDERNIALGDMNEFVAENRSMFVVAEMANGIAIPRRQKIGEKTSVTVPTTVHGVRIFDDLSRFMAGRVDWNTMIDKVARSYRATILNKVYTAFSNISATTPGLNNTYVTGGTYDEASLLALVEHVEAATGMAAKIVGTKAALRKCATAVIADAAKDDYYGVGYFGKLAGVPMVAVKNRHQVGTDTFVFPDTKIFVIASDDKPVKFVTEGEAVIIEKDGTTNSDMTMEYLYTERIGVAVLVADRLGVYSLS
ncbi:hypothetical protein SDC9_41237 [bioreactor metagenome]|uniref:Phage major capsid protein n=1 Tax=bioreactor metagenome TaxID=1076179 RepID=A0A644VUG4_9ZZZZ